MKKQITKMNRRLVIGLSVVFALANFTSTVQAGSASFSIINATSVNNGSSGATYTSFGTYYLQWTGLKSYKKADASSSISLSATTVCETGKLFATTGSTINVDGTSASKYSVIFYSDTYDITGITIYTPGNSNQRVMATVATFSGTGTFPSTTGNYTSYTNVTSVGTQGATTTTCYPVGFACTGSNYIPKGTFIAVISPSGSGISPISYTITYKDPTPTFTTQPTDNQSECINGISTLGTVVASGATSYQWYSVGTKTNSGGTTVGNLNGGNTATYTPPSTSVGTTYYYCLATNAAGSTASNAVQIIVNPTTSISAQPQSTTSYVQGATASALTTGAAGTGTISYLWYTCNADGTNPVTTGITGTNYTPSTASVGTTYYECIATGDCSTATSNVATVTITAATNPVISLTSGSANQSISTGSAIGGLVYTWAGSANSATVVWSSSSVTTPTGISETSDNGAKTLTISGTPSTAGTYNYSISSSDGGSSSSALTGSITVKLATPDVTSGAATPTNQGFTAQWAAVTGRTSYTVKVYQTGAEIVTARQTGITATSVDITGLSPNTSYTYTVTAIGDGSLVPNSNESSPSASVRTLNTAKAITVFSITNQNSSAINGFNISISMPYGTVTTSLIPSITHTGVSISPSGAQDFSSPVQYTVTAEDGTTQIYTATVTMGSGATDYFKTKATGNWNDNTIWQSSPNSGTDWYDATIYPDANAASVILQHNITYAGTPTSVGTVTINSGDTLITNNALTVYNGKTVTISTGAAINNKVNSVTISAGTGGTIQVNGTYMVTNTTGLSAVLAFTGVTFASGSTLYIGGTGGPRIPASVAGNVVWASTGGGSFVNSASNTISGNLYIINGTALNNGSGGTGRTLTVTGNVYISAGQYNPLGLPGGAAGTQATTINGNVYLSGTGKLYAAQPKSGAGVGTLNIKGNVYIQNPSTAVVLSGGSTKGTLNLNNTIAQTISVDPAVSTGQYSVDSLTVSNTAGVSINSDLTLLNITNNSSSILNVVAGKKLTISTTMTNNGVLNLKSDATGTATILPASASGTGTATVQQYLTAGRNWYISSPVTGATAATFDPAGLSNILYWYDEAHGSTTAWPQITDNATGLTVMQGYVANMATDGAVTFSGALNSGSKNITVYRTAGQTKEGFNLVGNPYASYLDWDQVTKSASLQTSIWQRTKNGGNTWVFDTYNSTGQLGIDNSGKRVNNHIPPMQAFWVRVDNGNSFGSLTVNNSMLSHAGSQTTGLGTVTDPVFKAPTSAVLSSIIRLQVSNGTNTDEALIYSNSAASNSFDAFDSQKMFNNSSSIAEIYTVAGAEDVAINGLNTIPYDTELALGFSTLIAGNFSIKASQISNMEAGTQVILKDYLNPSSPVIADLSDGSSYSFSSEATSYNTNRFTLIFRAPSVATGINSVNGKVWISTNVNGQLTINGSVNGETSVAVYNAIGQRVAAKNLTSTVNVLDTRLVPGVYSITLTNTGKSATTKVIIK